MLGLNLGFDMLKVEMRMGFTILNQYAIEWMEFIVAGYRTLFSVLLFLCLMDSQS